MSAGADYYRSAIEQAGADGKVVCTLKPLIEYVSGSQKGWVASDDDATRFWRADYLGNRTFRLSGPPAEGNAFGPKRVLRLWEYGAGDVVRHGTGVSLRRTDGTGFALETDVDLRLSVKATSIEVSQDGGTWRASPGERSGAWLAVRLPAGTADGPRFVRWKP